MFVGTVAGAKEHRKAENLRCCSEAAQEIIMRDSVEAITLKKAFEVVIGIDDTSTRHWHIKRGQQREPRGEVVLWSTLESLTLLY